MKRIPPIEVIIRGISRPEHIKQVAILPPGCSQRPRPVDDLRNCFVYLVKMREASKVLHTLAPESVT
jgi:hypothetical protein